MTYLARISGDIIVAFISARRIILGRDIAYLYTVYEIILYCLLYHSHACI